jgi:gas vesicle protein
VRRLVPLAAVVLCGAITLPAATAQAHGGGDSVPITLPPFPPGDGQVAQAAIADFDAKGAKDPELARVIAGPLAKAKTALQRAYGARTAGDALHAHQLEGLALEWTETCAALVRATAAERASQASAKQADDVANQLERLRALLAETQARKERALAELERVKQEAKDLVKRAAQAETDRLDHAKKGGPAATPKPTPAPKKKAQE